MFKIQNVVFTTLNKAKNFIGKIIIEAGGDMERKGSDLIGDVAYLQVFSRHRNITKINEIKPDVSHDSFITSNCTLAGDVQVKAYSNIGYNSVLRAELAPIR